MKYVKSLGLIASCAVGTATFGAVPFSGGVYSQNFDTLASVSSSTAYPWTNDSTLAGWSAFRRTSNTDATPVALTTYYAKAGDGTPGILSYGVNNTPERALGGYGGAASYWGSPSQGDVAGWYAMALTNTGASTLTEFTVLYASEQWYQGNQPLVQTSELQFGIGANFTSVPSWTAPGTNFNAVTVAGLPIGPVDGNTNGRTENRGGTVSNLTWAPGETLWVRWVQLNMANNDHGLGIDDLTFSAVPEPASLSLLGLGGMALAVGAKRRHGG